MSSRRFTDRPFPPYSYVPGKFPHPIRERNGHSYGKPEPNVDSFEITQWQSSSVYLFGIDLFNAQFFWEAHEQWEAIWHAEGRQGTVADFLKCLIKLAAAGVKHREGKPVGVQRHLTRARALLASVCLQHERLGGFELRELDDCLERLQHADHFDLQLLPV